MFYNHELLRRSGRFGVLWLAATKPRLLTESEYRQCDLTVLCEQIREYIQYRTSKDQGKPLFRSVDRLILRIVNYLLHLKFEFQTVFGCGARGGGFANRFLFDH